MGFSRGTWDPGSHEILGPHTKSLLKLPHFVAKNLTVLMCNKNKKKISVTGKNKLARRNVLPKKGILCHKSEFCIAGRNFLSHRDNSCCRNKFAVTLTGINLPSQE